MKKQLSLASKRKWVTGGILAFSAVSLLTTGFATWVVGVQRTQQERDIAVTVDTAENSSVRFSAVLSDAAIVLKETESVAAENLVSNEDGYDAHALEITFSELSVVFGAEYTEDFTKIEFEFKTPEQVVADTANDLIKNDEIEGTAITSPRPASGATYLVAPEAVEFKKTSATQNGSVKELKLENVTVAFDWGTFFNNTSPAKFYNSVFTNIDKATNAEYTIITNDIHDELENMKTYFEGLTDGVQLIAKLA